MPVCQKYYGHKATDPAAMTPGLTPATEKSLRLPKRCSFISEMRVFDWSGATGLQALPAEALM